MIAVQTRQKTLAWCVTRKVPIERRRQRVVDRGGTGNLMLADTTGRNCTGRGTVLVMAGRGRCGGLRS